MINYRKLILLLFITLIGCTPTPRILEEIQLVQSVGYDYLNDDEYIGVAGASYIPQGENAKPTNIVFTAVGKTSKQIRQRIQALSAKPIEIGRIGVVIFNKEVAADGILPFIDSLQRDPSIGRDILLTVSEESASEILKTKYIESETVSQYIIEVVDQNSDRTLPHTNLHRFLYQYYTKGFDAFMPMISKDENKLIVVGVALFDEDRFVGVVPLEDAYIFKILFEKSSKGQFETKGKEEEGYLSLQNLFSHTEYEVKKPGGRFEVHFTIKVKGRISESGGLDLTKKENVKKAEKEVEEEITQRAYNLVEKFKELQVDPLGLGEKARQKGIYDEKVWEEQYSELKVVIDTEVHVVQTGIME